VRTIKSISLLRKTLRKIQKQNKKIGFVPTMGALHEGHLSLVRKARRDNDIVVVSIFVNPTQFGPREDLKAYPRPVAKDKKLAQKNGVDILFLPSAKNIYPSDFLTGVEVKHLSDKLCGRSRPGHFKGVTTIVAKLLNIVLPDILYLGQKDAQQAIIIKKMVADLNLLVKIRTCPTVREADGLALSSRNQYLTSKQREEAAALYQSLKKARKKVLTGEKNAINIIGKIRSQIKQRTSGQIEYIECVDADTLIRLRKIKGKVMFALAVRFGKARLIDNIVIQT